MKELQEGQLVQFVEVDGMLPDGVVDGDRGTIMTIDREDELVNVEVPTSPYGYAYDVPMAWLKPALDPKIDLMLIFDRVAGPLLPPELFGVSQAQLDAAGIDRAAVR
jgi:hypothetical protein